MTIDDHPDDDSIKYHVVECTAHAREWISPAFCQLLLYELLYGNYQHMRQSAKWLFIPMLNPDGYAYTKTSTTNDFLENGECKMTIGMSHDRVIGERIVPHTFCPINQLL